MRAGALALPLAVLILVALAPFVAELSFRTISRETSRHRSNLQTLQESVENSLRKPAALLRRFQGSLEKARTRNISAFPWRDVCAFSELPRTAKEGGNSDVNIELDHWLSEASGGRDFLRGAQRLAQPDFHWRSALFLELPVDDRVVPQVDKVLDAELAKDNDSRGKESHVALLVDASVAQKVTVRVLRSRCAEFRPVALAFERFAERLARWCSLEPQRVVLVSQNDVSGRDDDSGDGGLSSRGGDGDFVLEVDATCHELVDRPRMGMSESYNITARSASRNAVHHSVGYVSLGADSSLGILHGLSTLLQLFSARGARDSPRVCSLPEVRLRDGPRFPWRGVLVDTARRFLPLDRLRLHIDAMAVAKLNVLHLHLTDDQGWRFESKLWPRLQEVGGADGKFYSQHDLRDLVSFAALRGVRVVPEIDVPGHMGAALAAYPAELRRSDQKLLKKPPTATLLGIKDTAVAPVRLTAYKLIFDVFSELASVFPDEFMHLGGDEVDTEAWQSSADVQTFANASADNLQAYFGQRLARFVKENLGRRGVVYSEAANASLAALGVAVEAWLPDPSLADLVSMKHEAIYSRDMHFDWKRTSDWYVEASERLEGTEWDNVLGIEGCLWAEFISPEVFDMAAWPALAVIAERGWRPSGSGLHIPDYHWRADRFSAFLGDVLPKMRHLIAPRKMVARLSRSADQAKLGPKDVEEALLALTAAATSNGWRQKFSTSRPVDLLVDAVPRDCVAHRNLERLISRNASADVCSLSGLHARLLVEALFGWALVAPALLKSPVLSAAQPLHKVIGKGAAEVAASVSVASCHALHSMSKSLDTFEDSRQVSWDCEGAQMVRTPPVCKRGYWEDEFPEVQATVPVCQLIFDIFRIGTGSRE